MAKRKKPSVLKVTTISKYRVVVIDGCRLAMLNANQVRIDTAVRLRHILDEFKNTSRITEERAILLAARLRQTVRDILPALPAEIDAHLSDNNRIDIMITFFKGSETLAPPKPAAKTPSVAPKGSLAGMGIGVA